MHADAEPVAPSLYGVPSLPVTRRVSPSREVIEDVNPDGLLMPVKQLADLVRLARDARLWRPSHVRVVAGDVIGRERNTRAGHSDNAHLVAAANWIARAQDAMGDGGIAGRYRLQTGWTSSYPETTGYLIPTMLRLASEPSLASFEDRAARAVAFLLRLQLPEGGFPGGEVHQNVTRPSVFNTGQILGGLVAWHRHSRDQSVLDAAIRAADWMVSVQDDDGVWRRHVYLDVPTAYVAHATCWLAELATYAGIPRQLDAARRNLAWVQTLADPDTHWFDRAGFTAEQHDQRIAPTHTIAYTLWGVLMTAELLNASDAVDLVRQAALHVMRRIELNRSLPGILDHRWRGRTNSSCVTGTVQMALIWMHLFSRGRDMRFLNAALLAIDSAKRAQAMDIADPGIHGGIPGSDPLWGEYIRLAYPNWAAKFFVDALLEKRQVLAEIGRRDRVHWRPPEAVPRSSGRPDAVESTSTPVASPGLRVVLYTTPRSTKVAQLLAACHSWRFHPTAVIIESRPSRPIRARLHVRLRDAGIGGLWWSLRRRLGARRSGAAELDVGSASHSAHRSDFASAALPPPRGVCAAEGIAVIEVPSLSDAAGIAQIKRLSPDIAVYCGGGILNSELLSVPEIGTLNAHMGILPRYRGMNVAEWAAFERGPSGCTVHFMDAGIDTGPILCIREFGLESCSSIEEVRKRVDDEQIALLADVLHQLCAGNGRGVRSYLQSAGEGQQYYRMHPELRVRLDAELAMQSH